MRNEDIRSSRFISDGKFDKNSYLEMLRSILQIDEATLKFHPLINPETLLKPYTRKEFPPASPMISNTQLLKDIGLEESYALPFIDKTKHKSYHSFEPLNRLSLLRLHPYMVAYKENQQLSHRNTVTSIQIKLNEERATCPVGFLSRINECFELLNADPNVYALLDRVHIKLKHKIIAACDVKDIHHVERVKMVMNHLLQEAIFKPDDPHAVYSMFDQDYARKTHAIYRRDFTPSVIIENLLTEFCSSVDCSQTYINDNDRYHKDTLTKVSTFFNTTLNRDPRFPNDAFLWAEDEEGDTYSYAINSALIISSTIQFFFDNGLFKKLSTPHLTQKYKNGTVSIYLDGENIQNTLIRFEKEHSTIQFFLGNAHHFSLDSDKAYDPFLSEHPNLLTQEDIERLSSLIAQSTHRKDLEKHLTLAGFHLPKRQKLWLEGFARRIAHPDDMRPLLKNLHEWGQYKAILSTVPFDIWAHWKNTQILPQVLKMIQGETNKQCALNYIHTIYPFETKDFKHFYDASAPTQKHLASLLIKDLIKHKYHRNAILNLTLKNGLLRLATDYLNTLTPTKKRYALVYLIQYGKLVSYSSPDEEDNLLYLLENLDHPSRLDTIKKATEYNPHLFMKTIMSKKEPAKFALRLLSSGKTDQEKAINCLKNLEKYYITVKKRIKLQNKRYQFCTPFLESPSEQTEAKKQIERDCKQLIFLLSSDLFDKLPTNKKQQSPLTKAVLEKCRYLYTWDGVIFFLKNSANDRQRARHSLFSIFPGKLHPFLKEITTPEMLVTFLKLFPFEGFDYQNRFVYDKLLHPILTHPLFSLKKCLPYIPDNYKLQVFKILANRASEAPRNNAYEALKPDDIEAYRTLFESLPDDSEKNSFAYTLHKNWESNRPHSIDKLITYSSILDTKRKEIFLNATVRIALPQEERDPKKIISRLDAIDDPLLYKHLLKYYLISGCIAVSNKQDLLSQKFSQFENKTNALKALIDILSMADDNGTSTTIYHILIKLLDPKNNTLTQDERQAAFQLMNAHQLHALLNSPASLENTIPLMEADARKAFLNHLTTLGDINLIALALTSIDNKENSSPINKKTKDSNLSQLPKDYINSIDTISSIKYLLAILNAVSEKEKDSILKKLISTGRLAQLLQTTEEYEELYVYLSTTLTTHRSFLFSLLENKDRRHLVGELLKTKTLPSLFNLNLNKKLRIGTPLSLQQFIPGLSFMNAHRLYAQIKSKDKNPTVKTFSFTHFEYQAKPFLSERSRLSYFLDSLSPNEKFRRFMAESYLSGLIQKHPNLLKNVMNGLSKTQQFVLLLKLADKKAIQPIRLCHANPLTKCLNQFSSKEEEFLLNRMNANNWSNSLTHYITHSNLNLSTTEQEIIRAHRRQELSRTRRQGQLLHHYSIHIYAILLDALINTHTRPIPPWINSFLLPRKKQLRIAFKRFKNRFDDATIRNRIADTGSSFYKLISKHRTQHGKSSGKDTRTLAFFKRMTGLN